MTAQYTPEQMAIIKLAYIENVTRRQMRLLLSLAANPAEVWRNMHALSSEIHAISDGLYERMCKVNETFDEDYVCRYYAESGIGVLCCTDQAFPQRLKEMEDAPILLFYKGNVQLLGSECFAVVGTRAPTRYGVDATEKFTSAIANAGFTVVSGMARGVDTIAHRTALERGANTIAVAGCGLGRVYPAENAWLFDEIVKNGLVISEYAPQDEPLQYHFPERNRLISALSVGVLVTEAGIKSGTMITVTYALDQGKDVFLVPGNVFSKASEGTNEMLKNPQCFIACKPEDIPEFYRKDAGSAPAEQAVQLGTAEAIVFAELQKEDKHFEELLDATGLSMGELLSTLTKLEIMGLVKKLSGNYYGV